MGSLADAIAGSLFGASEGIDEFYEKDEDKILGRAIKRQQLKKLKGEARSFDEPSPVDPATGTPLFLRYRGRVYQNPYVPKPSRPDPELVAMVTSGVDRRGRTLAENYRRSLAEQLGVDLDSITDERKTTLPPARRDFQAAQSFFPTLGGVRRLPPREHYNQLRDNGYSAEEARRIAGV